MFSREKFIEYCFSSERKIYFLPQSSVQQLNELDIKFLLNPAKIYFENKEDIVKRMKSKMWEKYDLGIMPINNIVRFLKNKINDSESIISLELIKESLNSLSMELSNTI